MKRLAAAALVLVLALPAAASAASSQGCHARVHGHRPPHCPTLWQRIDRPIGVRA